MSIGVNGASDGVSDLVFWFQACVFHYFLMKFIGTFNLHQSRAAGCSYVDLSCCLGIVIYGSRKQIRSWQIEFELIVLMLVLRIFNVTT